MKLVQGHVLALPHLPLGFLDQRALFRCENVVGIDPSLGLDEDAARSPGEGNQVSLVQIKVVAKFFGDDDLAPLAQATNGFPRRCWSLGTHNFRIADRRELSYRLPTQTQLLEKALAPFIRVARRMKHRVDRGR